MPRIALGIEYDGSDFAGWQAQANARSVQAEIERAASGVAAAEVVVHAAGRTDAGVHATGQVAHFDTDAARSDDQWLLGINSLLPEDVAVRWVRAADPHFDARRSALWRSYVYVVQQGSVRSALARRYSAWIAGTLDIDAMQAAAQVWLGEHDFSAFRAAGCQSSTPMRCLYEVRISTQADFVTFEFRANAFLYHMVRNLVGTLTQIGRQRCSPEWAQALLERRDRSAAGPTAPACGLTLTQVRYADELALPSAAASLPFGYHARSLDVE